MKHDLFREKALEKMFSSQEINNYIKTSNLSMWLVFPAVAILLVGVLIWGICGEIRLHFTAVTVSENGTAYCYISEDNIDQISDQTCVQIGDLTYTISQVSQLPVSASDHLSPYGLHLGNLEDGAWVYQAQIEPLPEGGLYRTYVLAEPISPISLLLK